MIPSPEEYEKLFQRAEIHVSKCNDLGLHTTSMVLNVLIYEMQQALDYAGISYQVEEKSEIPGDALL